MSQASDRLPPAPHLIALGEAAIALRIHPTRLYALAVRGEAELIRLDSRRWGLTRASFDALAERLAAS